MEDVECFLMDKMNHPLESRLTPMLEAVHTNNYIEDDPLNQFVAAAPVLSKLQKALNDDMKDTFNITTESKYLRDYNSKICDRLEDYIQLGLEKRTKKIKKILSEITDKKAKQFAENAKPIIDNMILYNSGCNDLVPSIVSEISRNTENTESIRKVFGYRVVQEELKRVCVDSESSVVVNVDEVINVLLPFIKEAMATECSKEMNKHSSVEAESYILTVLKNEISTLIENVTVTAMTMDETMASTHGRICLEIESHHQLLAKRALSVLLEAKRFKEGMQHFRGRQSSEELFHRISVRKFRNFMNSLKMDAGYTEIREKYETKLSQLLGIEKSEIDFRGKSSLEPLIRELHLRCTMYIKQIYAPYAEFDQSWTPENASSLLEFTKHILGSKYKEIDITVLEEIKRQPDMQSLMELARQFPKYLNKFKPFFSELETHVTKSYGFPSDMFIFSRPFFDLIEKILEWFREKTYDIPVSSDVREEL
jgi:hypothetical protein